MCALISVLSPRYQPNRQCGECRNGDDVREHCCPHLKLGNRKINPLTVLQMKENNGYRKTADAVTRADVILGIECAPNADRYATRNENTESKPATSRHILTAQPPKQRDEHPTAQSEKDDDDENAHVRAVT